VNLSQWLGRGTTGIRETKPPARERYLPTDELGSHANAAVRLLLITCDDQFFTFLREVATERKWSLLRVDTLEKAFPILQKQDVPLILYDWNNPLSDWQEGIRSLTALRPDACVLLASTVADEYLRREVARNRGYDVLPRSADRDKLIRTLQFAWFWRTRSRL
jgi:DNA-binding response OmpR family regulator